ncbi:transposase domain-containing protein [Vibrio alfacsensis]|uniref:Transposase domain-containing protein n=1 Tax=Vibrio alfacsensis TaxID=1074311 RepID=A0ABM6YV37_9VIBR|nr:transposase domain-containing protein [Vibrio alfacsensis]
MGLESFSYLRTLLTELPHSETVEQIEALLPWSVEID